MFVLFFTAGGNQMSHTRPIVSAISVLALAAVAACGESERSPAPPPPDPARCKIADLGEASDAIAKGPLPDDAMVRMTGLNSPKSLVWQDPATGRTYFVSRVTGAEGRWLYYMQELDVGETPKVLSVFEGHIQRWDRLPQPQAVPMAAALKKDYHLDIVPDQTYLITAGAKPEGCP